ncbi:DUF3558 domain-containing protein [Nocardia suismassiliense]|uniref:DUF3558 domain-containing protein n=1 Tax=Nocardia suismassiliense TaxID=2077092 RepID=UPI000D1F2CCE|nr:DUF3558 domain-containing protein [Nocardia suismassiliense]
MRLAAATISRFGIAAALAAALAVASTGCGGQARHADAAPSSAAAPQALPTAGFDPCVALTPQFLGERRWDALAPSPRRDTSGDISWQGCRYVARAGYGFVVETTNATLGQVRAKFPAAVDISFAGRKALRYEARPDVPGGCTINIEMGAGSLYLMTDVPQTPATTALDACEIATDIAYAVVPLLPAGS